MKNTNGLAFSPQNGEASTYFCAQEAKRTINFVDKMLNALAHYVDKINYSLCPRNRFRMPAFMLLCHNAFRPMHYESQQLTK